jgi:hypothetical protein
LTAARVEVKTGPASSERAELSGYLSDRKGGSNVYSTHESRRWLRRHRRLVLVGIAAALVVGVPAAWATFNDVPPSNPFYDDINALQGAGITQGCGGGNFCPTDNITRQAEAAFIHRSAGRAGFGSIGFQPVGTSDVTVLTKALTVGIPGVVSNAAAFVKADAEVEVFGASGCPCTLNADLLQDGSFIDGIPVARATVDNGEYATIPITGLGQVTTAGSHNYSIIASTDTGSISVEANLTLLYAPFGSTGTSTFEVSTTGKDHAP